MSSVILNQMPYLILAFINDKYYTDTKLVTKRRVYGRNIYAWQEVLDFLFS